MTIFEIGKINRNAIHAAFEMATIGTSLLEIDKFLEDYVRCFGMEPAFRGYHSFPANACISVNEQIVHSIPSNYRLVDGDLLTIDFGTKHDGWNTDAAETRLIGNYLNDDDKRLLKGSLYTLQEILKVVKDGVCVRTVAQTGRIAAKKYGLSIFQDFCGHEIGREIHSGLTIFHTDKVDLCYNSILDSIIKKDMMICFEPVVTLGSTKYITKEDNWTIISADGQRSAHQEIMVLVTPDGYKVIS